MLLILRSTARSWASTAASPVVDGPVTSVPPGIRRGDADAAPVVVVEPPPARVPVEFSVPTLLVPGGKGVFAALPAPLGSLSELLRPPALAGPDGTPLTAALPAPAAPALGEPAAVPVPADGPLAAPPPAPPAPPAPPPPPPVPCAKPCNGDIISVITATAA